MLSPKDIKALQAELRQAMKAEDIVVSLEAPVLSIDTKDSLIYFTAKENILPERILHRLLSEIFKRKDRKRLKKFVNDEKLGFSSLRSFWKINALMRDNDSNLTLEHIISEYRKSSPTSIIRVRWFSIIFGQSYREKNWEFLLSWTRVAIDKELSLVNKRYFYGGIVGLINDGYSSEAKEILSRRMPFMNELDKLFFIIPCYELGLVHTIPSQQELISRLFEALPNRGHPWDWFCHTYPQKIKKAKKNLMNVRVSIEETEELQQIILLALKDKKPLSFHRMGDGVVYRWSLPEVASFYAYTLLEDDVAKELLWWDRKLDVEKGNQLERMVVEALEDADILGVLSVYRLIRDANEIPMTDNITGRALLRHIEALDTKISLSNKILTEDRVHTIIYDKKFINELFKYADNIVIIGGLSAEQMNLPKHEFVKFIPLVPEQNKGLPQHKKARSLIDDFEAITEDIISYCAPGTLALISGGYAGKALVAVAKKAGAVALDIGSLADLLASYHTRSPADAVFKSLKS